VPKWWQKAALDIYLIQHAESVPEKEDPARPLSDEGKVTVEKVGALAARLGIKPDLIFHSERLRARQTAEILALTCSPFRMEQS